MLAIKPNTLLLAFLTLLCGTLQLRAKPPCRHPLASYQFQQGIRNISAARMEARKFQLAKDFVRENCFTSAQVAAICRVLDADFDRLAIAEIAFSQTVDPNNFYDVYDAFSNFSTVFRLHDYIAAVREGKTPPIYKPPYDEEKDDSKHDFPDWHYPNANEYKGYRQCDEPTSQSAFDYKYDLVKQASGDFNKLREAKRLLEQHCLSVAQAMKLAHTMGSIQYRFQFLKHGMEYIFDPENYYFAEQALTNEHYKRQFRKLYEEYNEEHAGSGIEVDTEGGRCRIGPDSFRKFTEELKQERHNQTRLDACTEGFERAGACFSTQQMAELVALFEYESTRLKVAQIGYDYVYDRSQYVETVGQSFNYGLSKSQLEDYIRSKGE